MEETKRDFKGVWIPRNIWLDNRIGALEKVILAEIDSLDSDEKGCWASNKYIAEFCQCSEFTVSRAISKLADLGYIRLVSFDGRQRTIKSCLCNSARQPCEKRKADTTKTQGNNIENKTEIKKDIKYIVEYLNEKAGTAYKPSSKQTQAHINARLAEGYTVDDFKTVIDKKSVEWKGTEWEKYLRPETLFGSKFENYLNAKSRQRPQRDGSLDDIF